MMALSLRACGVLLISTVFVATFRPVLAREESGIVAQNATQLVATKCLPCHNEKTKSGGFDFERRDHAVAMLAPGKADESAVVRAVSEGKMPPNAKLPAAEVALLRRWIRSGASYPKEPLAAIAPAIKPLWSFQPVTHPAVPRTPYDSLAKNAVDRFLFARLSRKGLHPAPPASRLALLRRVTFDLTGLPPTVSENQAFLRDRSPNAYEKVVDRLLASSAYGERWGRHWLDIVRYGESHGYEQNHLRPNAWPYRDYVIRAFNADKPYDRFITEQLAGDSVGKGNPDIEPATGFLVAGIHDTVGIQTEEGTRQQRSNDLDDIVSTTGAAFLGLTVGCAKCHDHKFDPILQRDYYRLTAVFAGVQHGERPLTVRTLTASEQQEADTLRARMQTDRNQLGDLEMAARALVLQRRGKAAINRPAVNARRNVDDFAPVLARFVRFTTLATNDGAEPCLDELQIYGPETERNLALASTGARATASSLLPGYPMHQIPHLNDGRLGNDASWISNEPGAGWVQIELPHSMRVQRVIWSRDGGDNPRFDDRLPVSYRIQVSEDGKSWTTVCTEAGRAPAKEIVAYTDILAAMTPGQQAERQRLNTELAALKQRAEELNPVRSAYIGQFSAPQPTYLLRRGDVMQCVEMVTPGALSQIKTISADLAPDPAAPEADRRLGLAHWIADPRNPLTARVLVNRLWQYHFGRGLISTPSDFGNNGDKPSHPELLDWLASDFMAHGWRIKRMQRLMVLSYAYQQTSDSNPRGMAVDAGNTLLWHMPLRRLEAEALRDALLATSGKLNRNMYGPGYRLFDYRVVNVAIYAPLTTYEPDTWRRSVYQQVARAIRDPLLGAFDCPESSQRAPRRESTTTALQSLALLNGPFITQQSDFCAERIRKEVGPQPAKQVQYAFDLAFGRAPMPREQMGALALVRTGSLADLCRALFNANEYLYY